MGYLNLHISPVGSYYYFTQQIIQKLQYDHKRTFIYILPVNRAVRYLKKALVEQQSDKNHLDPHIFTFKSLAGQIYHRSVSSKKVMTASMRLLLIDYLLHKEQQKYQYFRVSADFQNGFVLKTDQMINEFFQFGFRPTDFSDPPPSAVSKYKDFGTLLNELTNRCSDHLIDESALISAAANVLDESLFRRIFPDVQTIYISGFGIFSPPMLKVLHSLKELCQVEIKLAYDPANKQLFKHTSDAYDALKKMADKTIHKKQDKKSLSDILFKPASIRQQKLTMPTNIKVLRSANPVDEIKSIISLIRQHHLQDKVPLQRIGITFPDMEKYVPYIRLFFKQAAIPFNLSTGFSLAESPLIQSFLQVLKVAQSNFKTSELKKLLLFPYFKNDNRHNDDVVWNLLQRHHLNYLVDHWDLRLREILRSYRNKIIQLPGLDRIGEEELNDQLEELKICLKLIEPLTQARSAEEFYQIYIHVLKNLGLFNWYEKANPSLQIIEKESEFRAYNRFVKLLEQMIWMLKYIYGSSKIPLSLLYRQLTLLVQAATYNLREWSEYGVQILPRLEILSLNLDALVIGGLVEGDFPRHFRRDIFFNDDERAMIGLNASEDLSSQDRFLFFQLLSGSATNIFLSYPLSDGENQLLPSTFITAAEECLNNIQYLAHSDKSTELSVYSVMELIGRSLKNDIKNEQIELFQQLLLYGEPQIIAKWLANTEILLKTKSHQQITAHEGNLFQSVSIKTYLKQRHFTRIFSVTALESYSFCPMQYFLQRICRLEPEPEIKETISSLERGQVIHYILFRFYHGLSEKERKEPLNHLKRLTDTARQVLQTLPYDDLVWELELEKYFGHDTRSGLWKNFLELEERTISQTGFVPILFEVNFGKISDSDSIDDFHQPFVIDGSAGKIRLYGKIDRIETDQRDHYIVIDYKTGRGSASVKIKDVFSGKSFQLPVYIAAARQILSARLKDPGPAAGIYYLVQDEDNCMRITLLADRTYEQKFNAKKNNFFPNENWPVPGTAGTLEDVVNQSLQFIEELVNKMADGNFRHTDDPQNEMCTSYCPYKQICRKDIAKLLAMKDS